MDADMAPCEPALPGAAAPCAVLSGFEPLLAGRWESVSIARLEDDRPAPADAGGWVVGLDDKLREIDRLADAGTDTALAYLRRLSRRRAVAAGWSVQQLRDFRFPNARGCLAEALVHWELWFDGQCVGEHKSPALLRLESALFRTEQGVRLRTAG
jgi:hypothetical protein